MNRLLAISAVIFALVATPTAFGQEADTEPVAPLADEVSEAPAQGADAPEAARAPGAPAGARVNIALKGLKNGRVQVGNRVEGIGFVRPFVPFQSVRVWVAKGRKVMEQKKVKIAKVPGKNLGRFKIQSDRLIQDGKYTVRAKKNPTNRQAGFLEQSKVATVRYPDLDPGQKSNAVDIFNRLLKRQAYYTSSGRSYGSATERAVLAYRKVNGMSRTTNATPAIFKNLAAGRGGFKLKYPGAGKHVEADLSRQVMVLANHGKPQHIFHISSGTAATPTIQGHHVFTRKEYGTNNVGMVHSVYFGPTNKGYATHGYPSVPTYPASHGCLRNPIPNSMFIYNWISIGDDIWVYP